MSSDKCIQFINNAKNFHDINNYIFHSNSKLFLEIVFEEFIKQYFGIEKIIKRPGIYQTPSSSTPDLNYTYSDYHFEFDYSDKYLEFIKSITSNTTITNRQIIIFLKNVDAVPKSHQYALRRMLERYQHVKFFMSTRTLSDMEPAIISRSFLLNCTFPKQRIHNCLSQVFADQMSESQLVDVLTKNNHNIISTIIYISNKFEKPKIEQNIVSFLKGMTKERNPLNVVMNIRELCYKLFHLNVEFPFVCNVVINALAQHKKLPDIVDLSASIDRKNCVSNKNIILYEKYLLEVYRIVKGI